MQTKAREESSEQEGAHGRDDGGLIQGDSPAQMRCKVQSENWASRKLNRNLDLQRSLQVTKPRGSIRSILLLTSLVRFPLPPGTASARRTFKPDSYSPISW